MSTTLELPVCRWRGTTLPGERFACTSPRLIVGLDGVPAALCRTCYCRNHEAPATTGVQAGRTLPCRLRGEWLREQECPTCAGTVRLKVLACSRHGACTVGTPLPGIACCAGCSDYEPASPPTAASGPGSRQPGEPHSL
jgi:hypothetical protein